MLRAVQKIIKPILKIIGKHILNKNYYTEELQDFLDSSIYGGY